MQARNPRPVPLQALAAALNLAFCDIGPPFYDRPLLNGFAVYRRGVLRQRFDPFRCPYLHCLFATARLLFAMRSICLKH